jgi:type II secretory pathway pseudopilin PulG
MPPIRAGEGGFSLVELMVATVLSLAVVGGSLMVFASQRRGFDRQQEVVNGQQIGRFALATVADDIRQAGLWTRSSDPATVIGSVNNVAGDPNVITGTDTLTLRYVRGIGTVTTVDAAAGTITVDSLDFDGDLAPDITADDFGNNGVVRLAVSDGPYGTVVEEVDATALAGDILTLRTPLANTYDAPLVGIVHQIEYTLDTPAADPDMPSLYREDVRFDSAGNELSLRQQLANFVDDFQVEFGSGVPDEHDVGVVGAENVRAIRVALVTRSEEPVLAADTAFPVTQDSSRLLANDRYLRRVYAQTIALRN